MSSILTAGSVAPDFTLPVSPDKKVSLSEFRGKPVILAFYPADWSPVCGDQMALYNEVLPEFEKYGAQLLAVGDVGFGELVAAFHRGEIGPAVGAARDHLHGVACAHEVFSQVRTDEAGSAKNADALSSHGVS